MSLFRTGVLTADEEGFEPPVGFPTTVFKTVTQKTQALKNKELREWGEARLQTSLQKDSEKRPNLGESYPPELREIIDRWDNLPEHIKAAIMALVKPYSD